MSAGCSLCDENRLRVLETASDGVRTVQCAGCGLIWLDPSPRFDRTTHYDDQYYRPWIEEQARARARLWRERAVLVERFTPRGSLLDVGCGDGSFLTVARERGWQVAGTEVSRWAAQRLRREQGIEVWEGDLTSLDSWRGRFDAVTMWHVLEHTEHPLQNLLAARALLRDNGALVVAVPNAGRTLFRAVYPFVRWKRLQYYTPGERELHLYHFTPATLHAMLARAGFDPIFEGPDAGALTAAHRALEKAARLLSVLSGANWSQALLAIARKRGTP